MQWMGAKNISIEVEAKDEGRVMGRVKASHASLNDSSSEELLEALHLLVQRVVQEVTGEKIRIVLDINEQRGRQEEKIAEEARKIADEVKKTRQAFRLDPMPSRSRWIIHQVLKDDPDVETLSEGEGLYRKVVIKPKQQTASL